MSDQTTGENPTNRVDEMCDGVINQQIPPDNLRPDTDHNRTGLDGLLRKSDPNGFIEV